MELQTPYRKRWIDLLEEEDVALIKRLVLFSGSLQALATAYDINQASIQEKLDRLIAKIKILDNFDIQDDFERHLRNVYAEEKPDPTSYRRHLAALADLEIISNGIPKESSNGNGHTNGNGHVAANGNGYVGANGNGHGAKSNGNGNGALHRMATGIAN